jgi:hypothetical protein
MKLTGTWLRKMIAYRSLSNNDLGSSDCRTMLCKVPRRTGSCNGTGTVIVVSDSRFCMIR